MTLFAKLAIACVCAAPAVASAQDSLTVIRGVAQPNPSSPENFTGSVRVSGWFESAAPARVYGATVAFDAGARTNWHVHALGQTLVVTAGTGRVRLWGGPVQEIRRGDVVTIPPGAKHWHGASADAPMTHVAVVERPDDGPSTEWMEPVTDEQYAGDSRQSVTIERAGPDDAEQPSRAQQLLGDIAPQLADLTDDVLYGQVWANADLSGRDRSLVTVSALVALNRPDQLRSHLARAHRSGVSQQELIAAITHLAFYAGWPNAVTAIGVAREVFQED